MPELPEVETVRRALNERIGSGLFFAGVERSSFKLRFKFPNKLADKLKGLKLSGVERRAKYLLFQFGEITLLNHLGMTGSWRPVFGETSKLQLHEHVRLKFVGDDRKPFSLTYHDPRRFGYFDLLATGALPQSRWLSHLGPEPLDERMFTESYLFEQSRRSSTTLKSFIMNQETVVGMGNIYASESLFISGLDPRRKPSSLTQKDCGKLVLAIREVLHQAINGGGTTIRDFVSLGGEPGGFGQALRVYGRNGEKCSRCGNDLKQIRQVGRSTYFCSRCQK
jgi:formamidopyrimidine-DNA glycosylase